MHDRPVILTGFMGSGKSSAGRLLAEKLSCRFVDLDVEIAAAAGRSITDIFATGGEEEFRRLETEQLKRILAEEKDIVLAAGGGAVIAGENRRMMKECGVVVNLRVTLEQVLKRLHGCTDRPLLAGGKTPDSVKSMMAGREQFYADAHIQIDTDNKSVEDVAAEILGSLEGFSR